MSQNIFSRKELRAFLYRVIAEVERPEHGEDLVLECESRIDALDTDGQRRAIVVGFYPSTGERFSTKIEADSLDAAEDGVLAEYQEVAIVTSFWEPFGGLIENLKQTYITTNT